MNDLLPDSIFFVLGWFFYVLVSVGVWMGASEDRCCRWYHTAFGLSGVFLWLGVGFIALSGLFHPKH